MNRIDPDVSEVTAETLNRITSVILASSITIHRRFGPGLLERAYCECLCHDLTNAGLRVERAKPLPLVYDGLRMACAYRADIVVEGLVLVEVKAVDTVVSVYRRQVTTYLRLGNYRVGLLLNFGAPTMKQGIERIVNGFPDV